MALDVPRIGIPAWGVMAREIRRVARAGVITWDGAYRMPLRAVIQICSMEPRRRG